MYLHKFVTAACWQSWGLLVARLIMGGVFIMALGFKVTNIGGTAQEIASVGFPLALPLAYAAIVFELLLVLSFLSGAYFRQAAFGAMLYVLFLGFAFHGPSHWGGNMAEFGFFVDHFTFAAGLIALVAVGPGRLSLNKGN